MRSDGFNCQARQRQLNGGDIKSVQGDSGCAEARMVTDHFESAISSVRVPRDYPMFPLIHCADLTRREDSNVPTAGDILRLGRIDPVPCDVFSENLVYTYIGRPAYREFKRPVCFILKPLPALLQNLPSAVIVLIMAVLFRHFRRSTKLRQVLNTLNACIVAVLLNSAVHLFMNASGIAGRIDWIALAIFVAAFLLLFRFKVNPLYVMAASGILGLILYPLVPGG